VNLDDNTRGQPMPLVAGPFTQRDKIDAEARAVDSAAFIWYLFPLYRANIQPG
jgi:hypothetical protein